MKSSDQHYWDEIITHEWDLDFVRDRLSHPATQYPGRPVLLTAQEVRELRLWDISDQFLGTTLAGQVINLHPGNCLSVVDSTLIKLRENLSDQAGPVGQYLQDQFRDWEQLADRRDYGFYAFYFSETGEFAGAVQFPPLPVYKLALTSTSSQLLQDRRYQRSWLANRQLFNHSHVVFAGASVASSVSENLCRDGRVGYLTLADPKPPNATNFNRTTYDVFDVGSKCPKAISLARRLHRQDPTQIIYLVPEGLTDQNLPAITQAPDRPAASVLVEAIDDIDAKIGLTLAAMNQRLPLVQISDVGSKAQLTFKNPTAAADGDSLIFGLPNHKLQALLRDNFIQAAAYLVGLDNALGDEVGRFVRGQKNTPFGRGTPQLGSTASVAAGVASEQILRYLLDRDTRVRFPVRRVVIDKKHLRARTNHRPSLQQRFLGVVMEMKNWRGRGATRPAPKVSSKLDT